MKYNIQTGIISEALRIDSPNQDARPDSEDISLIVIHGISLPAGEYGGPWISDLFTNRLDAAAHPSFVDIAELKVSSHFLIRRDGDLQQFVPVTHRAWHAGVSRFQGRENCNDFSIGIELEGVDDSPYESVQYEQLAKLIHTLVGALPRLDYDAITGHADIAPGRKTDPGPAFDWQHLRKKLA